MLRLFSAKPGLAFLALCWLSVPTDAHAAIRPCPETASPSAPMPEWPRLFFVSSRLADCSGAQPRLTSRRASGPYFGEADATRPTRILLEPRVDWQAALDRRLDLAPGRRAFIYVHGFNNSASDPLERSRALAIATGFDGPVIALLWPSWNSIVQYSPDAANADWTTGHFRWLLAYVASRADRITLVSHSMGNRITLDPVRDLALTRSDLAAKIDHWVIASADVDRAALARDLGQDFGSLPGKITLYASSRDWPLVYSSEKHRHPRGGYLGPRLTATTFPVRAPNAILVDTSDASHTFDAHADFLLSRQGAADLCRLLRHEDVIPGRAAVPGMDRTVRLLKNPPADECTNRARRAIDWLTGR